MKKVISALVAMLAFCATVAAQNPYIFFGDEDEYWSNSANWEGNAKPHSPSDNVLIDGVCMLDEDVIVSSLTIVEGKSLTIPTDKMLTVSSELTNSEASGLIIEDGGQLIHPNAGVFATVQKNVTLYDDINNGWHLIASPMVGDIDIANVNDLTSDDYDLYFYDEPTSYWMNQKAQDGFSSLESRKGYLYANSEEVDLEFAGELQNGSTMVEIPLSYTAGPLAGFNLVGNPFAYNVTSYSKSEHVADGCFVMNEDGSDLVVSVINEEYPLKPAESFFVKATDEGAKISFNPLEGSRSTKAAPRGTIRVELTEDGKLTDRLIVKAAEGESLEKLSFHEQRTKLFVPGKGQELAIVACAGKEQPFSFKAAKDGTYTLSISSSGEAFSYLHLVDLLTGKDIDLLATPSYTFDARTTDDASRFRLLMAGSNAQRAIFRESGAESVHPLLPTRGKETHQRAAIEDVLTFAPEGFATYYDGEKDLVLPTGMKARIVTAAGTTDDDGNTQLTYETIADGDAETKTVPHATAVLLQVEPAIEEQTIAIALANPTTTAITQTNLLHGSDEAINTYGNDGDTRFYKLSYSADGSGDFGWYWGAGGGAAFQSGAHKAWLALPANASSRFLSLPGYDGDATSVNEELRVKNEESGSAVWYTVDGRRLNGKPTAKGIYTCQGRKVVVK